VVGGVGEEPRAHVNLVMAMACPEVCWRCPEPERFLVAVEVDSNGLVLHRFLAEDGSWRTWPAL
jgi:hypothetical protein